MVPRRANVLSRSQDAILYFRRPILIWLQCALDTALYHGAHSFGLVIRVICGKCVRVLEIMPSNLSTVIVLAQLCYAFRRWNEIGLFSPQAHGFVTEVFLCVQTTDLAKNLYQNATLENINLIQIFSARERKFDDVMGTWRRDFQASHVFHALIFTILMICRRSREEWTRLRTDLMTYTCYCPP